MALISINEAASIMGVTPEEARRFLFKHSGDCKLWLKADGWKAERADVMKLLGQKVDFSPSGGVSDMYDSRLQKALVLKRKCDKLYKKQLTYGEFLQINAAVAPDLSVEQFKQLLSMGVHKDGFIGEGSNAIRDADFIFPKK